MCLPEVGLNSVLTIQIDQLGAAKGKRAAASREAAAGALGLLCDPDAARILVHWLSIS